MKSPNSTNAVGGSFILSLQGPDGPLGFPKPTNAVGGITGSVASSRLGMNDPPTPLVGFRIFTPSLPWVGLRHFGNFGTLHRAEIKDLARSCFSVAFLQIPATNLSTDNLFPFAAVSLRSG